MFSSLGGPGGFLLLDKPVGLTSRRALVEVSKFFSFKKFGHAGTLDPLASGLLLVCLGRATKFAGFFIQLDKVYLAVLKLGEATTTDDREGEIISQGSFAHVTRDSFEKNLLNFLGDITQVPPVYSAVKYAGKPLYSYARVGLSVPRFPRKVKIYELKCLSFDCPVAEIRISCSKGTYVRALIRDIGSSLGCGAHLVALRRLSIGDYSLDQAITLYQLATESPAKCYQRVLSIDNFLSFLPSFFLSDQLARQFACGYRVGVEYRFEENTKVRVYRLTRDFLGIGCLSLGYLLPSRIV